MKSGRTNRSISFAKALLAAALLCAVAIAAPRGEGKRAKPPTWPPEVLDTFFPDAREALIGERPDYGASQGAADAAPRRETPPAPGGGSGRSPWVALIAPETIESEIKRLSTSSSAAVASLSTFKGGAYQDCRRDFSLLAVLFAIVDQYDDDIRWRDVAGTLRDQFARAAHNAKVGTDQTFRESSTRAQDLDALIRGSRPQVQTTEPVGDWREVADRPPLMQRLNAAHQDRLLAWLANDRQFEAHREEISHEAQIMAVLADVIAREDYEYWDDETYAEYAQSLRAAAREISDAAKDEDYGRARAALDRATKACADCHDGYRG